MFQIIAIDLPKKEVFEVIEELIDLGFELTLGAQEVLSLVFEKGFPKYFTIWQENNKIFIEW